MSTPHMGGSFAPPLSDELIAKYEAMIDALSADDPIRDAMTKLLHCCGVWWDLPESKRAGSPHMSGRGSVVPLEHEHKAALFDAIPWSHRSLPRDAQGNPTRGELDHMGDLFETISNETRRELRDAAHHLLWHVHELDLDREPITTDKL